MRVIETLALAFIDTFGITRPGDRTSRLVHSGYVDAGPAWAFLTGVVFFRLIWG